MAKISEDCINEAFAALRTFGKEELEGYVRDVFVRAKTFDPQQGMRAINAAIKEINDEAMQSFFQDATIKANNILKFNLNAQPIKDGLADFRGVLAGRKLKNKYFKRTEKDSDWRKRNIPDAVKAEYEKLIQRTIGDLTHEEVEHFSSGKFDEIICDIYDGKKVEADPISKRIAEKLKDYFDYTKSQLVLSNAMKMDEFNDRRYFGANHDQQKIVNGAKSLIKVALKKDKVSLKENKATWRTFIKQFIDMDETFKRTDAADLNGVIDEAQADKIIDRIFDNITTGKSNIFTKSVVANDREAVAKKSRMFFVWKNLRSQYEYNKTYGRGNLFQMMMSDGQSSASKIGTAKMWGDNPYTMYNDLKKVQQDVNPQDSTWWKHSDHYFKSVMGLDKLSTSPNVTNIFSNLKTITTMARLPFIAIDSLSDIGYISSFAQRFGANYFEAWSHHLTHLFDTFRTEDRTHIAKLMKTQVDSHLGFMGRWVDTQNTTELLNKASTAFFKKNLLESFDRGNKIGNMTLMAKSIGKHANTSWDKLPLQTQKYLGRFIDSNEWDLLRKKNDLSMFTTDNVQNLTDAEIREHYKSTDKSLPLSEVRDDLYRRVYAMFVTNAENTVLSPTEFERAFLLRGTDPGEGTGIFLRTMAQFKMYTLSYIDRVLIDGMRGADSVQQKIMWATTMLMGTIPLSYLSIYLKNVGMGLTMPKFNQMNVPEREKFLMSLMAPSLSLFLGLLDQRNQNSSMVWSLLGSPTTRLMFDAMAAPLALVSGNPKHAGKILKNASGYILPTQTTPIISPLIRQAMGDEAYLEPGQSHIFGR